MLTTLATEAARRNLAEFTLRSTESAHRFYLSWGSSTLVPARRGSLHHGTAHAQGADAVATERLAD